MFVLDSLLYDLNFIDVDFNAGGLPVHRSIAIDLKLNSGVGVSGYPALDVRLSKPISEGLGVKIKPSTFFSHQLQRHFFTRHHRWKRPIRDEEESTWYAASQVDYRNVIVYPKIVRQCCLSPVATCPHTLTSMAGSDVVQSGHPIFDDFFQYLWPYIGNNTANVVFQMVKRLWLIRIDQ
ncbi:hypothetical protein TNCV_4131991 [Trichonephila clavipes]|nr:hypothetical protein TNCV_4131991 [Trichonephila clavipes]